MGQGEYAKLATWDIEETTFISNRVELRCHYTWLKDMPGLKSVHLVKVIVWDLSRYIVETDKGSTRGIELQR